MHFKAADCTSQTSFINDVLFGLSQVDLGPEDEFIVLACDGIWYQLEPFLPSFTRMIIASFREFILQCRQEEYCCG